METRANYILVGGFVLTLFAAIVAVAVWFAKIEFDKVPDRYLVYFTGSVTGLNVGSVVRYRGVPVGSVVDIAIDPQNVERIRTVIDVTAGTPVKQDTVASLGIQGITGIAFIQLSGGTQKSPALRGPDVKQPPVIPSKLSGLEKVLEQAPEIFEKTVVLIDRLSRLVDDKNLEAFGESLENIRGMTRQLGSEKGDLARLLTEGRETMMALRSIAMKTEGLIVDVDRRLEPFAAGANDVFTDVQVTLSDLRGVMQTVNGVVEQLGDAVEDTRTPLRDFSETGLYEFSQLIAESRVLVATLTRLSAQIEREPARFFFGDTQKGFEPE